MFYILVFTLQSKPRLHALTAAREASHTYFDDEFGMDSGEDETGEDEDVQGPQRRSRAKHRVTVDPKAILLDAPDFSTTKQRKWDSSRSLRWNQDAQREEGTLKEINGLFLSQNFLYLHPLAG